jgi:hypothetical protein
MRSFALFAVLIVAPTVALAASMDAPKRKSGLWEMKISSERMKGARTVQQCVDQKTDELMTNEMSGNEKPSCSKNQLRKEGDKLVSESVCKANGSTATTRGVFTGGFDSAYKADLKVTYEPPLHGRREASSTIEAKWLGACKPGQKPGDISMPGMPEGMPNMEELMKKMPKK